MSGADIFGTAAADELYGTSEGEALYGLGGDDLLFGAEGDDLVYGGDGDDLMLGGEGDDLIDGGAGNDNIYGEYGTDTIDGGAGWDRLQLSGWAAEWSVKRTSGGGYILVDRTGVYGTKLLTGVEEVTFGQPYYSVDLASLAPEGTAAADLIEGGAGLDWIFGLAGDDQLRGGAGTNLIDGGDGADTALYAGSSSDYYIYVNHEGLVQVERVTGSGEDPAVLGTDVLIGVEQLLFEGDSVTVSTSDVAPLGTAASETITGTARNDFLFGCDGDDVLQGLAGRDVLCGGFGNDTYDTGAGDDHAYDFDGGDDTYLYGPGGGNDYIEDFTGFDVLQFGAGIDPDDVIVTLDADGSSYVLAFDNAAGSIVLFGSNSSSDAFIVEEVRFADNTVWTPADLAALVV